MIEVTEEMRNLVVNWRSKSPSPYFALEYTIQAIIELHEQSKPKPEPVGYVKTVGGYPDESEHKVEWAVRHKELKNGQPLYTTPPTQEPLSETIIECIGYRYGLGTLEGSLEFTWYNDEIIDFARSIEQAHGIVTLQTTT